MICYRWTKETVHEEDSYHPVTDCGNLIQYFYGSTIQPNYTSKNVQEGELYHFSEKKTYWTEITNYCCQDGYLYVLYERKAIMQIFRPDGNYSSSYA